MESGPPYERSPDQETKKKWKNWRDETQRLEKYPDRDVRIIFPEGPSGISQRKAVADFGDFDPRPTDPDPDVWPLEGYDPGYPADIDDLHLYHGSYPAPHVAWVTTEYLTKRYGYNPLVQQLDKEEVPKWKRGAIDGLPPYEVRATNPGSHKMTLTDDRLEALRRIANLWNGKTVNGQHLIANKLPAWNTFLGDLADGELRRLLIDPNIDYAFAEAFKDHDWFEDHSSIFLKPQYILRKKVWYSPTQKGKKLINSQSELPDLIGDPRERLKHRVGVGLTVLDQLNQERNVETYTKKLGYSFDVISESSDGSLLLFEVITGHNNNELNVKTYEKLRQADEKLDAIAVVVFDKRDTAFRLFNYLHNEGIGTISSGPFNSEYNLQNGREKIRKAYEESEDWIIQDWFTISEAWSYYGKMNRREIKNELELVEW